MYAIKIRKSDEALITLLNGGVPVPVNSRREFLIVDTTGGPNFIVSEAEFDEKYASKIRLSNSVELLQLNKR